MDWSNNLLDSSDGSFDSEEDPLDSGFLERIQIPKR